MVFIVKIPDSDILNVGCTVDKAEEVIGTAIIALSDEIFEGYSLDMEVMRIS
jgi:hypothetical protein